MYSRAITRTLAVLGAVLGGLIVVCWHRHGGTGLDHWVAARLTTMGRWTVTNRVAHVTDPWYVLVVVAALALRQEQAGHRRRALALVVPVIAALALTELVLKPGVDARSAGGTVWTFPSGNVTGGVALAVAVWWVEVLHQRRSGWRRAAGAALGALVALSSAALVADRIHFLTDAVGGVCVGVGVPLAILGRRRTAAP